MSTLRRSQSLKNLSGVQERSWVTSSLWDQKKSVSQLVQQYQSSTELSSAETAEVSMQAGSGREEVSERRAVSPWRRYEGRESGGDGFRLSRSRSMEFLPQREPVGTSALRALFESKVALQQDFSSSPRLNTASPACPAEKQRPPGARRGHSTAQTPAKKDTPAQSAVRAERRRQTISGVPEACVSASRHQQDDRRHPQLTYGDTPPRQSHQRRPTSVSVRDRSSLYLSRAAAADSTGGTPHPVLPGSSEKKTKASKMADIARQIRVSEASHEEDDLPLPPPPPVPPQPLYYEESPTSQSPLPVPPPKESFSTFYQQRQKSELKRLFKHIHPDLKGNLNDAVDDELVEALQCETAADAGYQGEVQSMRWFFENWSLDNIGDVPHTTKKLLEEEHLQGGDVRGTSSMFELCQSDSIQQGSRAERQMSVRGDVRTSTWLFETKPFDALNQLNSEDGELVEAVLKDPIHRGDVRGARLLFESKPLDALGHCCSIEDQNFLTLKSELQEQKGDVQKTIKLFQTEPCCAIRDNSGNMHEIKSICREEIKSSNTNTARWLFETQPLDVINKDTSGVKIIRGISLEEGQKGGVDRKKWMFETQPFHTIREGIEENRFQGTVDDFVGEADVENKRKLFETQPLAALKGETTSPAQEKEDILGGNVKTSLWLFETQPVVTLADSYEVGRLKKVSLSVDEQGEVKGKKHMFENYNVRQETIVRDLEIEKGDVKSFKHLFETIPLGNITQSEEEMNGTKENDITAGNVKGNRALFETTPLYAIKDCSGNFHEVTTVSREESIKGNVQNCKWMFETKPLDQFEEGKGSVEVIKGITRQEDITGDVKMAKWLFETQTLDCIHSKFNKNSSVQQEESQKGDVKTCKWLFETQPMDILYDKADKIQDKEAIENTNVKSFTWLFESQPLNSIKDSNEHSLKLCKTIQDDAKAEVGVKTVKHLFETETLDRIRKVTDTEQDVKYVSQVNVQSGDVSRVKEIFESKSLDDIGTEAVSIEGQDENIQRGSVHKFTWLFENRPINMINDKEQNGTGMQCVTDVEGGDVHNKKFIFETFSLDKIQDKTPLDDSSLSVEKCESNVDVKSSTMLFESQPLYAIRDKEGQFHEVTTVKKEEVMSGDVRGARWMFETKPLDAINAEKDVYVIRAVTQEDVLKGDVKSARWKFETQPLDSLADKEELLVKAVEDFGKHNVQLNKQLFESEQSAQKKYVRMVSVTDVQQGDVRTSTWLFENQPIDSLKGEAEEQGPVKTVHREDNQKGEVKRCTWLFESQPLDKIKEADDTSAHVVEENIPKADVKSTTWLFETTPLDQITVGSVADSLSRLSKLQFISSSGIIIEANEIKNVYMAKYQFISEDNVQIQKEEKVEGNLKNIMLQLLYKPTLKPQITLLTEVEQDQVNTKVLELPANQPASTINLERDQRIKNIAQMIEGMLVQRKSLKKGIVMQESAGGQAEMTVYSLVCPSETRSETQDITRGDVRSTIGNLLATANNQRTPASCRPDEIEKGNVNLYRDCIEKGDLQTLKSLQIEPAESEEVELAVKEQIEIVQGDVREAKRNLYQQKEQVERTISDVLPGDVKNAKKIFTSEGSFDLGVEHCIPKGNIIRGDISSAKQQLGQAAKQSIMVEKEEIVAGDIKATLQSLERAKQQSLLMEREVITPGTIYDMDLSTQGPETESNPSQTFKEEIVSGDVKAAKQSLEMAKNQSMRVERETIVPGKIYNVNVSSQEKSSSTAEQSTSSSTSRCQRITTTFRKVSDTERDQGTHEPNETCQKGEMPRGADIVNTCKATEPAVSGIPPHSFVISEYDVEKTNEETEAEFVRGDVKAAIRSLQNAATEQRLLDKEDIVRGNLQLALQSLEKSSVNVSKGDFKTAMISFNSGKAYSGNSKKMDSETVHKQGVVVSMPPFDTELSPSVSVTYGEPPAITSLNSAPVTLRNIKENSTSPEDPRPPPLPPKTSEKPQSQKPALPPKPQRSKPTSTDTAKNITPLSRALCPLKGKPQTPVIPPKMEQEKKSSPPPLPHKPSADKKEYTLDLPHKGNSQEISNLKNTNRAIQDSPQITRINDTQAQDANTLQVTDENGQGKVLEHTEETLLCQATEIDKSPGNTNCNENVMDRNVIQKINAAEEIRMCMQSYGEESSSKHEINMGFQAALENFGGKEKNNASVLPQKINVVKETISQEKQLNKSTIHQEKSNCSTHQQKPPLSNVTVKKNPTIQNSTGGEEHEKPEDKVVLRKKKAKKETEDERMQRLSVHKEEIMRGNVKAAMEIFENLRKREELKTILFQVQEIEGETSNVDVSSLKTLFENVPAWLVTPCKNTKQSHSKGEKKVEEESLYNEMENGSSVDAAFGDLEKASKDILNLKEQTLAKLIDIEEVIRKALYSVSNLKSEADIAGLSGLFDESLKTEQSCPAINNIRKISIVSSKAKTEQVKETSEAKIKTSPGPSKISSTPKQCMSTPSSPSFISIHSAARKPTEQPTPPKCSTFKPKTEGCPPSSHEVNGDLGQSTGSAESSNHFYSPASPRRKVSVLEVQTVPEAAAGIIGTKTVSEKYEETDCFGNTFVSSTTSTFVTKQSETKAPSLFEVASPPRYEVMTSPLMRRSGHPFSESAQSNAKERGTVFVTFGQPKAGKR